MTQWKNNKTNPYCSTFPVRKKLLTSLLDGIGIKKLNIADYMPDALLGQTSPAVLPSVISACAVGALFLLLAVRVLDKRDVK